MRYVLPYLLTVNAVAFLLMLLDKEKAKKRKYRIPEATLLGIALLGGSIGAWFGMQVFRHKTKHRKFTLGIPLILGAQVFFTILCWYYIR